MEVTFGKPGDIDNLLATFDRILRALTLAVAAIAAISLGVAGILIMNVMLIAVSQRTSEIGLLCALGAGRRQILGLFIGEATVLAALGGLVGLGIGMGGAWILGRAVPALPTHTSWTYVAFSELLAVVIGLLAGVLPALHAARLNPIEALRAE